MEKEEETEVIKNMIKKNEEKYHRPVTSSVEKKKEEKKKGMDYAQYKEKYGVGKRPQTGIGKNWVLFFIIL